MLTAQLPLGWEHHQRFKRVGRRTWISHAHLWLGRAAVTLGIINGGLGLRLARADAVPVIVYAFAAAVAWLVWLRVSVGAEVERRKKEKQEEEGEAEAEETALRQQEGNNNDQAGDGREPRSRPPMPIPTPARPRILPWSETSSFEAERVQDGRYPRSSFGNEPAPPYTSIELTELKRSASASLPSASGSHHGAESSRRSGQGNDEPDM